MKHQIINYHGINLEVTHTNGKDLKIIEGEFSAFEQRVIAHIIDLIECDNSDAQGIVECHNDLLIQSYKESKDPEETALLIDQASFIKPKNLQQAIDNINRLNDYYQDIGMNHDDNYIRIINRTLCAVAASDRPALNNFCLDYYD